MEFPGEGLRAGEVSLGSWDFCGIDPAPQPPPQRGGEVSTGAAATLLPVPLREGVGGGVRNSGSLDPATHQSVSNLRKRCARMPLQR